MSHMTRSKRIILIVTCVLLLLLSAVSAWLGWRSTEMHLLRNVKNPPSVSGHYLAGDYARRKQDMDKAAQFFLDMLAREPTNQELIQTTYSALLQAGKLKQALQVARQYSLGKPLTIAGNVILAMEAISKNEYQAAERILTEKTMRNSAVDAMVTPFLIEWCKAGTGKFAEAHDVLANIATTYAEYTSFVGYQRALMYDIAGNTKKATYFYDKISERLGKSYRFIKAAGNFYERTGAAEKAKKLYMQFNSTDPMAELLQADIARIDEGKLATKPFLADTKAGILEVLYEIAGGLYKGHIYRDAQTYLQLILFLEPEADQAKFLLASYFEQRHFYEQAFEMFEQVPKTSDFYWQAQISMAQNMYRVGKVDEAKKTLRSLQHIRPASTEPLMVLAEILNHEKDYKEAASLYSDVLKKYENNPQAFLWSVYYMRGVNYERADKWEKAEPDFLKALELKPDQPDVLNYLGYSWVVQGKNLEQARQMISKALEQRPEDPQILDSMGWSLYHAGELEEALDHLEAALELLPTDATINDHLGDVFWKLGRTLEAEFQWNHALKFARDAKEPDVKLIKQLEKKLVEGLSGESEAKHDGVTFSDPDED